MHVLAARPCVFRATSGEQPKTGFLGAFWEILSAPRFRSIFSQKIFVSLRQRDMAHMVFSPAPGCRKDTDDGVPLNAVQRFM